MTLAAAERARLERALELAERGARTAAPNPAVGCVLVAGERVVGEGWHERPGALHAEAMALAQAGAAARGATAYVTLEPCSHHGRTPPCADALVAAGVARVVVAAGDPTARSTAAGWRACAWPGVDVEVLPADDPLAIRARRQTAGFRTHGVLGRPHVAYKAAATLDGRTATRVGDSRWISSPASRALVHEWRARAGAVLVGSGTALSDDPELTARDVEPPVERQPLRVVWDRAARLEPAARLLETSALGPVLVLVAPDAPAERRAALEAAGAETVAVASLDDGAAGARRARRDVGAVRGRRNARRRAAGGRRARPRGDLRGAAPAGRRRGARRAGRPRPGGDRGRPPRRPAGGAPVGPRRAARRLAAGAAMSLREPPGLHPVRRAPGREGPSMPALQKVRRAGVCAYSAGVFTGIVQEVGEVRRVEHGADGSRLPVATPRTVTAASGSATPWRSTACA